MTDSLSYSSKIFDCALSYDEYYNKMCPTYNGCLTRDGDECCSCERRHTWIVIICFIVMFIVILFVLWYATSTAGRRRKYIRTRNNAD